MAGKDGEQSSPEHCLFSKTTRVVHEEPPAQEDEGGRVGTTPGPVQASRHHVLASPAHMLGIKEHHVGVK